MEKGQAIKKTGRITSNAVLWVMEMGFKITAPVAAAISLGTTGGFLQKIGNGFSSLPETVMKFLATIRSSDYVTQVINDYNSLSAASFNQKYGGGAINYVMEYLNNGVLYLQNVYQNITSDPVSTSIATLFVFLVLYLAGRSARFVRQRGQGSVIDRMERNAGDKVFRSQSEKI